MKPHTTTLPLTTVALVRMLVALTYSINTLTLSYQATYHNPTIFHHIDIDHVGTQSSSARCVLMRPNKTDCHFQATYHNPTIFHHIDIDHLGTQSSSASCTLLMMPNKLFVAAGFWVLFLYFILVATGFHPFYYWCLSAHACGFNIPY